MIPGFYDRCAVIFSDYFGRNTVKPLSFAVSSGGKLLNSYLRLRPCSARKKNGIFLTFMAFFHQNFFKKWRRVRHTRKMAFF